MAQTAGKGMECRCGHRSSARAARPSLYAEVTQRIISQLEAGRFPWVQPWNSAGAGSPGLPRNGLTGRAYSGVNVLLLWEAAFEHGFFSQRWLTFRQAQQLGGCVRKGEHGSTVVFADRFVPKGREQELEQEAPRFIPFLKRFTVFNLAQCEGLPERLLEAPILTREPELVPAAEALIRASRADFRIGGDHAFYSPTLDYVQVPPRQAFRDQINYYRTALHELGHWTGHATRLARDLSHGFGTLGYAREELCAELASAFLCAELGIEPTVRHADYLGSWLEVLRADNRAIFRASAAASKAADLLLAFQSNQSAPEQPA